ncbi:hypothetical protein GBAR_LOCUS18734 [Geodia barretti]|uniref:N-terminal of MaoC-like dehydratase domain-containing protein n=1 Tax=Geodia barretti TaxID=519541 RepID=A0AA35SQS0_GEOBA|nr:hypothetical protein GBAR_LOCUS18734 [Geodia barretti]
MDVAAGEAIDLGCWTLTEESVRSYLDAVGDDLTLYLELGVAPPLALCAYALGAMLEKLSLPVGAIHSIQEMEAVGAASIGQDIYGEAVPERPRKRGGLRFMTVGYTLRDDAGQVVQTGKTTVLTPESGDQG